MTTPETQSSISGRSTSGTRRAARIAAAAGLVTALVAAGAAPVLAADDPATGSSPVKIADPADKNDKLGATDAQRLSEAEAAGQPNVTVLVATAPGATEQVAGQLDAVPGASVGRQDDKLGYVRATLPTGKADAAIRAATKLSSVQSVDLQAEIEQDDPTPDAGTTGAVDGTTVTRTYPAPGKDTPAKN
ncbi:serine protease, partial [Streptomyces sp. NPDC050600]